jgi:uncharacterized protein YigE (DUF2233 family)
MSSSGPRSTRRPIFAAAFLVLLAVGVFAADAPPDGFHDERVEFRGEGFRVLDADLRKVRLELFWKDADGRPYAALPRLKADILAHGRRFLAATNAGIYSRDYAPLGLHVERGVRRVDLNRGRGGGGNFFLKPNGVFYLTKDGARIVATAEYRPAKGSVLEAVQSGPLLLRKGAIHPKFAAASENRKVRSGIGVRDRAHVVVALSDGPVTFEEFAALFRDKLGCSDALYLDGTISRIQGENDPPDESPVPFAGVIVFSR